MTVISASASGEVQAPLDQCWRAIEDVARAPEWQGGLERMEVVERDSQGRALICDTVSDAKVRQVFSQVRFSYEPPHRLVWRQVAGDDLDLLEGAWELEAIGSARTRATYSLSVDPGPIPRLARGPLERVARAAVLNRRPRELAAWLRDGSE